MPERAYARAHCCGTQPLQFRMLGYVEKMLVEILIATHHIVCLYVIVRLHTATPAQHEIGAELFTFFICELIVEPPVLTIQLCHFICDVKFLAHGLCLIGTAF